MSINLFVVESPYQVLSAFEAANQLFKGKTNILVVSLSGSSKRKLNDFQIIKTVEALPWDNVEYISFYSDFLWFIRFKLRYVVFKLVNKYKDKVKNLLIGDFRSEWMHYVKAGLNPSAFFILDDGAATLTVVEKYLKNNLYWPREKFGLKEFFDYITYFPSYKNKARNIKPHLFTVYKDIDVPNIEIIKHRFTTISNLCKSKKIKKNTVYFFGSKYSEAGVISFNEEIDFLKKVFKFYISKNYEVTYYAHRDESDEKLSYIAKLGNVKIVKSKLPAEVELIESETSPVELAGAYTSFLYNAKLILSDVSIRSFKIPKEIINNPNKENIENIYKYYAANGILVENV